jgi:FtsP/CotA-like multicopper oxidase with cupredoxin domain
MQATRRGFLNWFFHCHNLYHLAAGMATSVKYVS